MPFLMAETPIIKEGMNGFYPWADKEKIQKNSYVNDIAMLGLETLITYVFVWC